LIRELPSSQAARSFIGADSESDDVPATIELEPPADDEIAPKEKPKRPAPVHPAAIAWTMLLMEHMRQVIAAMPEEGTPNDLRAALMVLLDNFQFSKEVSAALTRRERAPDVPQVMLNIRWPGSFAPRAGGNCAQLRFRSAGRVTARAPANASSARQQSLTPELATQTTLAFFHR
jgi:hypothetical protein